MKLLKKPFYLLSPWRWLWAKVWNTAETLEIYLGDNFGPWVFEQMMNIKRRVKNV